MYKQLIIARKDLNLSPGKLAAQVSHGSMAFLTNLIRDRRFILPVTKGDLKEWSEPYEEEDSEIVSYCFEYNFDKDLYDQWINGIFTKVICEARNKNQLMKAVQMAKELGMKEREDFWLIKDCCLTELTPEEVDENGVGRTLTCIGFRPMEAEVIEKISKKFQLYK